MSTPTDFQVLINYITSPMARYTIITDAVEDRFYTNIVRLGGARMNSRGVLCWLYEDKILAKSLHIFYCSLMNKFIREYRGDSTEIPMPTSTPPSTSSTSSSPSIKNQPNPEIKIKPKPSIDERLDTALREFIGRNSGSFWLKRMDANSNKSIKIVTMQWMLKDRENQVHKSVTMKYNHIKETDE